jgi:hypothetical protein
MNHPFSTTAVICPQLRAGIIKKIRDIIKLMDSSWINEFH